MTSIMIDLETLGTGPQSAIISAGLVVFDKSLGEIVDKTEVIFDLDDALYHGAKVNAETVVWWLNQGSSAKALFNKPGLPEEMALTQISNFIHKYTTIKDGRYEFPEIWANGLAFDLPILQSAFLRHNWKDLPWDFRKTVDLRTFRKYVAKGKNIKHYGVKHSALDDAVAQANFVMENL